MPGKRFWIVGLLFAPAVVGLVGQGWWGPTLGHRLLALGFGLMGIEQGKMAIADCRQIARLQPQLQDPRLVWFRRITESTIAIELVGFYLANRWLGWGALIVLLSQIWFNALAGVELHPDTDQPLRPCGPRQRLPVLLADGLGLLLVGLWLAAIAPQTVAALLLAMVIAYGGIKYLRPLLSTAAPRPAAD